MHRVPLAEVVVLLVVPVTPAHQQLIQFGHQGSEVALVVRLPCQLFRVVWTPGVLVDEWTGSGGVMTNGQEMSCHPSSRESLKTD